MSNSENKSNLTLGGILWELFWLGIMWYIGYSNMEGEIKTRTQDLDLMQYDSKQDKLVPKDSVCLSSGDIRYLLTDSTNDD